MDSEVSAGKLATIRALLAKAEGTEFPAEAETYRDKAMELISRYGVDQAMLAMNTPAANTVADRVIFVPGPYATPKASMLNGIVCAFGGRVVRRGRQIGGGWHLHLFGMSADLERAEILWTSLLIQMDRFRLIEERGNAGYYGRGIRSWRRDYMDGFAGRVIRRVAAAESAARASAQDERTRAGQAGPSVALVLADRNQLVQLAFAAAYPHVRNVSRRRPVGAGYDRGRRDGDRADIGGTRLGGAAHNALGGGWR